MEPFQVELKRAFDQPGTQKHQEMVGATKITFHELMVIPVKLSRSLLVLCLDPLKCYSAKNLVLVWLGGSKSTTTGWDNSLSAA